MDYKSDYGRGSRFDDGGEPKYSRLFVIGGKSCTEEELRGIFSQYGDIDYISVKKDRNTNQPKGICYVKFKKTSDAAEAMEELNGKPIGTDSRPIKIVIASDMKDGSGGPGEDITATRLFIMVPKSMDIPEIKEVFSAFGEVEHVSIVRDKSTGSPRGLAYVNFYKFSHAARALENCDESFRAKFAEPKGASGERKGRGGRGNDNWDGGNGMGMGGGGGYSDMGSMGGGYQQQNPMASMMGMMQSYQQTTSNSCRVKVLFNPSVSKDMFWALFNIVPGLVSCDLVEMTTDGAIGSVVYNNPQSAAYAVERINGFEYPTGSFLALKIDDSTGTISSGTSMGPSARIGGGKARMAESVSRSVPSNIQTLISTIQQATETLKTTGFGDMIGDIGNAGGGYKGGSMARGTVDAQTVCSAKLPPKQPTLPANTKTEERLFFVLREAIDLPDPAVVTDVFARFGNLIDAQCIRGKKCGYARYASKQSALEAVEALNNEDLLGSRMKVEVADEDRRNKRARVD